MEPREREEVERLLFEEEDRSAVVAAVAAMTSSQQLFAFAQHYNWDNGIEILKAIANHQLCDRATALLLFWRAEGIECIGPEAQPPNSQQEWFDFCRMIADRLVIQHYSRGPNAFDPEIGRVRRYKLEKQGVPTLLLDPVAAVDVDD